MSEFKIRQKYCIPSRIPYYDLAGAYLPRDPDALVVDIGAGDGSFVRHLRLAQRFPNCQLLDGNNESVRVLRTEFAHASRYVAPEKLPFSSTTVSFIHLSHIVEHLYHEDLYVLLKEIDRVLIDGGVLVISTPLLWDRFYDDMSHIKPYNPSVFLNYLSAGRENASAGIISRGYVQKELVYRFRAVPEDGWGSQYFFIDSLMRLYRVLRTKLGFRKYIRNGYTLILQK